MAAEAATLRSEEELVELRAALENMHETMRDNRFGQADQDFHMIVMEVSRNRLAQNITKILYTAHGRTRDSWVRRATKPSRSPWTSTRACCALSSAATRLLPRTRCANTFGLRGSADGFLLTARNKPLSRGRLAERHSGVAGVALVPAPRHSFVLPAVIPVTRKRCENRNTMITGATETSVARARAGS